MARIVEVDARRKAWVCIRVNEALAGSSVRRSQSLETVPGAIGSVISVGC